LRGGGEWREGKHERRGHRRDDLIASRHQHE
jgi:hypothetical protein